MITRLLVLVVAAAGLGACANEPAAPVAPDAKAVLAASTPALATGAYRYRVAVPEVEVSGVTDVPHRRAMWTTTFPGSDMDGVEMRLLGDDQYSRTGAARWQHIDQSRIPKAAERMGLTFAHADRTDVKPLLDAVTEAKQEGQVIRGTIEGTRVRIAGATLSTIESRLIKPVSFVASVDGRGRLTHLEVELPPMPAPKSEPAAQWTLDVSDYDTAADVARPAGVKEMPDSFYVTMGS
ncbi:hypothetical protein [Nucisporomicrobium flavum]|uniref:hypothetical protein n=1 Tax=Nucisporomicrobium flavum TaxID=2785915 RepID=UPI0018F28B58|nr:hypothetical protein [Nucisporomicrobium flavum]